MQLAERSTVHKTSTNAKISNGINLREIAHTQTHIYIQPKEHARIDVLENHNSYLALLQNNSHLPPTHNTFMLKTCT